MEGTLTALVKWNEPESKESSKAADAVMEPVDENKTTKSLYLDLL